ncbi:MAG: tetrahydrofolate dehydrogenase/cyclohydrolase catalytic domain-containing protein, partial [Rhizobiaceae bacterium]
MAERIDGKAIAAEVIASVKEGTARLLREKGIQPGLAVIIVGEDPASEVYVSSKSRMANECGFLSVKRELPAATSEAELVRLL